MHINAWVLNCIFQNDIYMVPMEYILKETKPNATIILLDTGRLLKFLLENENTCPIGMNINMHLDFGFHINEKSEHFCYNGDFFYTLCAV